MEAMTAPEERANDVVFRSLESRRGLPASLGRVWTTQAFEGGEA